MLSYNRPHHPVTILRIIKHKVCFAVSCLVSGTFSILFIFYIQEWIRWCANQWDASSYIYIYFFFQSKKFIHDFFFSQIYLSLLWFFIIFKIIFKKFIFKKNKKNVFQNFMIYKSLKYLIKKKRKNLYSI